VRASNIVDAETAVMQPREENPQLSEVPSLHSTMLKSPPHTFENEPSLIHAEPAARLVAAAPLIETESAVARAQQAKSLLAELDLNTAIRLRWVLRATSEASGRNSRLSAIMT
jgi:hypothetical protein